MDRCSTHFKDWIMRRIFVAALLLVAAHPIVVYAQSSGRFSWQTVEDRLKGTSKNLNIRDHRTSPLIA